MTENKPVNNNGTKPCAECGAPVPAKDVLDSLDMYGAVNCAECIRKIEADEPLESEKTPNNTDSKTKCVDANDEVVDGAQTETMPTYATKITAPPELTISDIKQYICPNATDKEAYTFMQLCSARNLNPFTKEAYLIKYGGGDATIIVGKDAFTRRAEEHPMFDGFDAGIIVKDKNGEISSLDGTFYTDDQVLLGGWAIVRRKDHTRHVCARVTMKEYIGINKKTGKPNAQWTKMPATMIRKVALVQSLREAFPTVLGGCYDASEMGDV